MFLNEKITFILRFFFILIASIWCARWIVYSDRDVECIIFYLSYIFSIRSTHDNVIYQSKTYDIFVAVLTLIFFSGFWFSLNALFLPEFGWSNFGSHISVDDEYLHVRVCLKHFPETVTLQRDERFPYLVLSPTMSVITPKRLIYFLYLLIYTIFNWGVRF